MMKPKPFVRAIGPIVGLAALLAAASPAAVANDIVTIDRLVYRPLRRAPKLAPLVSAIGVSFLLMNIGLLWGGAADQHFPDLVSRQDLIADESLAFTFKDLLVVAITEEAPDPTQTVTRDSPLGRALVGARAGERITYRGPDGEIAAEVVAVRLP